MKRIVGVSLTALSVAVLVGAAGCTRTSDGSFVMRRPSFSRLLSSDSDEQARIVHSKTLSQQQAAAPAQAVSPPRTTRPMRRTTQNQAKLTIPAMSITKSVPFKRSDPAKPLACKNETSPSGRVRVVCN